MCRLVDVNRRAQELAEPVTTFLSDDLKKLPLAGADAELRLLVRHAGRRVVVRRAWQESGMLFGVFAPLKTVVRKGEANGMLTVNLKWIGANEKAKILHQLHSAEPAESRGVVAPLLRPSV